MSNEKETSTGLTPQPMEPLAVRAAIHGLLSPFLTFVYPLIWVATIDHLPDLGAVMRLIALTCPLSLILGLIASAKALILGGVAIVRIERSQGVKTGEGWAAVGIVAAVIAVFLGLTFFARLAQLK